MKPASAGTVSSGCADGVACYLETENERNVAFYEKHGYQVVQEGEVSGIGLQFWALVREPQR